jgi:segregation and condensation protein A
VTNGQWDRSREELIQRLLEYKHKEATDELRKRRSKVHGFPRGNIRRLNRIALLKKHLMQNGKPDLIQTFTGLQRWWNVLKMLNAIPLTIIQYNYTVQEEQTWSSINGHETPVGFHGYFLGCEQRIHAIVTFLALLEMINNQVVTSSPEKGVNNFGLSLACSTRRWTCSGRRKIVKSAVD